MRSLVAVLMLFFATSAHARCWRGENVSWYVDKHTASGESYRHNESTCAHRTAKFGTRLKVTHRGKSVTCRVNDRGPNKWTKCTVDLNKHAAKKLGILKSGVVQAKIETVPLVEKARAFIGKTAAQIGVRRTLWCSAFLRVVTKASGVNDVAKSWLNKPRTAAAVGAIAVMTRGRGGHVGIVSGFDKRGNPILISGNHGRRVAESVYPKHRVIAYVSGG